MAHEVESQIGSGQKVRHRSRGIKSSPGASQRRILLVRYSNCRLELRSRRISDKWCAGSRPSCCLAPRSTPAIRLSCRPPAAFRVAEFRDGASSLSRPHPSRTKRD